MDTLRSRRYHQLKNWMVVVSLLLDLIYLIAFFICDLTFGISSRTLFVSSQPLAIALYLCIFGFGLFLVNLPLRFFVDFLWEHKFNLSTQEWHQWLADHLKKSLLSFIVALIFVEVIYSLIDLFLSKWWIAAGIFWLFISFVLARLTPNLIIPMFFKYLPVTNAALKARIFQLFTSCKIPLKDVYGIDLSSKTKKANAFFCGLGNNRRVVLSDTLMDHFSIDEIEVVVAHELAHLKHRDIIKMLLVNILVVFPGLYVAHLFLLRCIYGYYAISGCCQEMSFTDLPADIGSTLYFPALVLGLGIFSLVTSPLINAYSRHLEREADRFSIVTTKKVNEFISMMKKLGEMNLSDEKPSRFVEIFLYDHPPIYKRIAFAEKFKF